MIEKKHVFFTCLCKTHSDHKGQQRSTASFSIRLKTFMYHRKKILLSLKKINNFKLKTFITG